MRLRAIVFAIIAAICAIALLVSERAQSQVRPPSDQQVFIMRCQPMIITIGPKKPRAIVRT